VSMRGLDRLRPWYLSRFAAVVAILSLAEIASFDYACAAMISGVLTGYENTTPLVSRDLHFQNAVTGDIYLSPTHADGSFHASLPPGSYRLRTETGAILLNSVVVDGVDINLGQVSELAPLAPQRWWQSQAVAPTLLSGPAPSTAYLMTSDTTPLPADASTVRKGQIDWTKPPPETQASEPGSNIITGMATEPAPGVASSTMSGASPPPRGPYYQVPASTGSATPRPENAGAQ
jgi:hypothetical protein